MRMMTGATMLREGTPVLDAPVLDSSASGTAVPPAPTTGRPRRPRWPWFVVVIVVLALALAGLAVVANSRVSSNEYDDVVAARDAVEATLAEVEATLTEVEAELAEANAEAAQLQGEVDSLTEARSQLQGAINDAINLVGLDAYQAFGATPEIVDELEAAGLDLAMVDEILSDLGHDVTYREWVARMPWKDLQRAIFDANDRELEEAFDRLVQAEVGSQEAGMAMVEFKARLVLLTLDALLEAQAIQ